MDAEELIDKCLAIDLKEEEEDIVTFMGRMKINGENCGTLPGGKGVTHTNYKQGWFEGSNATSLETSLENGQRSKDWKYGA